MSQAARQRGRGRNDGPVNNSDTSSRRGLLPIRQGVVSAFDGPASRGTGSGAGSQGLTSNTASENPSQGGFAAQGAVAGSRRSSTSVPQSQASVQVTQMAPQLARDPAREGPGPRATDMIRNIDLPASFYNIDGLFQLPTDFKRRPGFNNTGKEIKLALNSYIVRTIPQQIIYQYDIIVGSGAEKRIVNTKVWDSQKRKQAIGDECIYDGNKLAWSFKNYQQVKLMVDLDEVEGKPASKNGRNAFRLHMVQTKKLDVNAVTAYLQGKIQYNVSVMEAINFMDHLLREGPTHNPRFVPCKRSFFVRDGQRADLGGSIEVFRGVYQSMRVAEGSKLIINLDVANSCFWKPQSLLATIIQKNKYRDANEIISKLKFGNDYQATKKYLCKLSVQSVYKGNKMPDKVWKIESISNTDANTQRIEWRDPNTGAPTGEKISVAAYFKRKYNLTLQYPGMPLVKMTKGKETLFPMELLNVVEHQRYGAKLDELQTAAMIKFAVSPPQSRLAAINEGKGWLNWDGDKFLNGYGLKIENTQNVTSARILPPPGIKFGKGKVEQPQLKGKWDLRGKQFLTGNPKELVSWAIGVFKGRNMSAMADIEAFAMNFAKTYRSHGGQVANGRPHIMMLNEDVGTAVGEIFQATGNKFQLRPQLMVFLVQNKNAQTYLRIKKNCECRFGVVSQVMQAAQAQKGAPQYLSNVMMKVNAKLGGCTSQVVPNPASGFKSFGAPTMFIGADVSHASPGSEQPSMAALTVSFDKHAGRYAGMCQTNGYRTEMITEHNMRSMLAPVIQEWMTNVGGGRTPQQVYYMRDGVSEGQFAHVLQQEVPSIKLILTKLNGSPWTGKLTVVVASKRHHIRAFPKAGDGDQKGNPNPGTLIERDVTMPNEWDFYLYSHIALQGTSRPVHYTVLLDEADHAPGKLQNMIYEHCYQYMRSTTSVSLHPAVYYAHIVSNRAKAHEDVPSTGGPTGGAGFKQNQPKGSDEAKSSEPQPLMAMPNGTKIWFSMWYI